MIQEDLKLEVPPVESSEMEFINSRCLLRKEGDQRVVIVAGLPVHHYSAGDDVAEVYVMVSLVDSGFAKQKEIAEAFRCSARTLRRHQRRYAEGVWMATFPRHRQLLKLPL